MSALPDARSLSDAPGARADGLRRGWCPGALRPMAAKDGLLVRLRLTAGILPAPTALSLAQLAVRFGNGRIDLSVRGNLQLRGVGADAWAPLLERLRDLALIDENAEAEAARNVLASPLAGCHDGLDIRPLVGALEAMLSGDARMWRLPAKILFLVDDGAAPSLGDSSADIRFDFQPHRQAFAIGLGGTRESAVRIGACAPADLVPEARRLALAMIALFVEHPDLRRTASLARRLGAEGLAAALDKSRIETLPPPAPSARILGSCRIHGRDVLGLGVPFGRLNAEMLREAAEAAAGELRLTPWRAILLPGVAPDAERLDRFRAAGFIIGADDPRLHVAACTGRAGCANATTETQADAMALTDVADAHRLIHVSGCEKGCAHPTSAPLTLVGRNGRYDLVLNGRPGDPPVARELDLTAVRAHLGTP